MTLFEFDIEQDTLRKPLLIKQETEWNKLGDLAPFCLFLVFWGNSHREPLFPLSRNFHVHTYV